MRLGKELLGGFSFVRMFIGRLEKVSFALVAFASVGFFHSSHSFMYSTGVWRGEKSCVSLVLARCCRDESFSLNETCFAQLFLSSMDVPGFA